MKSLRAFAIVNKKKPELDLNDIYNPSDIKEIRIGKDEKIIEVIIKPI